MIRKYLIVIGLLLLNVATAAADRPNILLILSDDHAKKALSCYGNTDIQTPGLDRLAKEGMRFEHALTPNSFCTPARAAVLTGKYSHKNGVTHLNQSFDGSQQTFPKLLQAAGYETSLFGKWHLLSQPTGFDFYCVQKMQGMPFDPIVFETGMPWIPWSPKDQKSYRKGGRVLKGYNNDAITTEALTWLKEWKTRSTPSASSGQASSGQAKPFCMLLHPKPPHAPYHPPKKYEDFLKDVEIPEPATLLDDYKGRTPEAIQDIMTANRIVLMPPFKKLRQQLEKENPDITRDELTKAIYQEYIKGYYRLVKSVDDNVARVLDYLDESGLAENTLVVYTSDQGFSLGEHGFYNKQWMYEGPLHQPLLVRYPGVIEPGTVHESMVSHVDLAPTILAYAGVSVPDWMQGHSLTPILEGKANKVRDAAYYHFYEHGKRLPEMIGIRTETHKLIHYPGMKGAYQWELFDLEQDPEEMNNLYGSSEHQETRESLKSGLRKLIKDLDDPVDAPNLMKAPQKKRDDMPTVFDGKSLDNWSLQNGKSVPSGWEVIDGTIHRKASKRRVGHIVTRHEYGDFDLSFEWKLAKRGNSGVKYRVRKYGNKMLGCEYQIFDVAKTGRPPGKRDTGAIYSLFEPDPKRQLNPSGQFNASRIVVRGDHIQHWLNGRLIVSATVGSPEWEKRVANSKFNDVPDFGRNRRGRIMLTDHGAEVWYRNLRISYPQAAEKHDVTSRNHRPNIVLMMSDDQGWGETGYNGHPHLKTPILDEMAASGLRLDRFYAASPVCTPTRASVLTGRHANRSGAFGAGWSIRPEEVTLAPILNAAGYRTAHFGKWHVGAIKEGSPLSPNRLGFDESLSHDNFFELNPELSRNGKPAQRIEGESSEILVKEALAFAAKSQSGDKPFFIVIWFGSPHSPYESLENDRAPYKQLGEELSHRLGEIAAMDRAIGMFRDGLDELGERNNTLLWFNSDNGITKEGIPKDQQADLFKGSGLRGNKSQMYEGGLRVPGIIEWPAKIAAARSSSVPCVTSDIMPTLLDILNIKHPSPQRPLDGISLKKLIVKGTMQTRPTGIGFWGYDQKPEQKNKPWLADHALNEMITMTAKQKASLAKRPDAKRYFKNHKHPVAKTSFAGNSAGWIDGRYKLVTSRRKNANGYELYDLEADRGEANNIASRHPEIVSTMVKQLNVWQQSVENSLTGADYQ